jgi:tRNA (guanine26-N2/guanine27-N2)-dimethyltransferase
MEFNRDISVLVMKSYLMSLRESNKITVLDGLAGTGIRGIRFANEISKLRNVVINDRNRTAYKLIKKNLALNKLDIQLAKNEDLNMLLINNRNKFDVIDIDPFGSPVEFIEQSCRAIRDKGILSITATDTATLCGRYPKTCLRRYGTVTVQVPYRHELGMRVLIGYCVRQAAKYELELKPILVHSTDHYYRIYFTTRKGSRRVDNAIENLGYLWHNTDDGTRGFSPEPVPELQYAGPLWIGKMYDQKFISSFDFNEDSYGTSRKMKKMIDLWLQEADMPGLFYEIPELSSRLKISPPKLNDIFANLSELGYNFSRTHFSPQGFRTDADIDSLNKVLKKN